MKIWKQYLGELIEIPMDSLTEEICREICKSLPDEEGDYAPYINETLHIIAVTDRALRDAELLQYSPNADGGCTLEGSGLSTLEHIVVPNHSATGEAFTDVACCAFFGDSSVRSVTFLGSVSMQDMAFEDCTALERVTVCGVLAELGASAFSGCTALTRFDGWDATALLGDSAFEGCTALENFCTHRVRAMDSCTFSGCESMTRFDSVPEIRDIPDGAFEGCRKLSEIHLPQNLDTIGWRAFEGCESMREIELPEGLSTIEMSAFYGCSSLEKVTIPYSVTRIGDMAFCQCTGLTYLRVPHAAGQDGLLEDEDIRRFTSFYRLYDPEGWESYNIATETNWMAGVEFSRRRDWDFKFGFIGERENEGLCP